VRRRSPRGALRGIAKVSTAVQVEEENQQSQTEYSNSIETENHSNILLVHLRRQVGAWAGKLSNGATYLTDPDGWTVTSEEKKGSSFNITVSLECNRIRENTYALCVWSASVRESLLPQRSVERRRELQALYGLRNERRNISTRMSFLSEEHQRRRLTTELFRIELFQAAEGDALDLCSADSARRLG
jgi:hypothetical protein